MSSAAGLCSGVEWSGGEWRGTVLPRVAHDSDGYMAYDFDG